LFPSRESGGHTPGTRLASARDFGTVDPSVGASRLSIEGKRIECRFCSWQPVLLASPLVGVDRRVRPGGKLCHGDCADDRLDGELAGLRTDRGSAVQAVPKDEIGQQGVPDPTLRATCTSDGDAVDHGGISDHGGVRTIEGDRAPKTATRRPKGKCSTTSGGVPRHRQTTRPQNRPSHVLPATKRAAHLHRGGQHQSILTDLCRTDPDHHHGVRPGTPNRLSTQCHCLQSNCPQPNCLQPNCLSLSLTVVANCRSRKRRAS